MSLKARAITEYASLSGKIHSLVIDKTLTISGACADAKAAGDAIEALVDDVDNAVDAAAEAANIAIQNAMPGVVTQAVEAAEEAAEAAVAAIPAITSDAIRGICV